jgi:maleylpyruvate isomerase
MKLYDFWRSAAGFRVRIALNLKGIATDRVPVNLFAGDHRDTAYGDVNPLRLVPVLVDGDVIVHQSLAIIEYLDEVRPEPPLLPADSATRAQVRGVALAFAADTHPLHNIRVTTGLREFMGASDEQCMDWSAHWSMVAFRAVEDLVAADGGQFCFGDTPTLADCCLVPQIIAGQRFEVDMTSYPAIMNIGERCLALPAFQDALPANQPDAP